MLFIATANTLDTIPAPLRDRMEILQLSGYTDDEKVEIAQQYLIPKQLAAHGLERRGARRSTPRRSAPIIRGYTREAGVRNLEREIATRLPQGRPPRSRRAQREPVRSSPPDSVSSYLGGPRFFDEVAERTERPGVATGWPGRRPVATCCSSRRP